MKKILLLSAITGASILLLSVFLGGDEQEVPEMESTIAEEKPKKDKLASNIEGIGPVMVAGPCYEGTRGNDLFPPKNMPASDCYNLMSDGQDFLDSQSFEEDVYVRVSTGSDTIMLGPGDDVVEVRGFFDIVLDAGAGENILVLPGMNLSDVEIKAEGEDILLSSKRGPIRLKRQYPREGEAAPIKKIVFDGDIMDAENIYVRAIAGQATDGNDTISGTLGNDDFYPGLGDDVIHTIGGNNSIYYEGGNDTIIGALEGSGVDTLSLPYLFEEVYLDGLMDRDLVLTTPGGKITLQFQIFFADGDVRTNINRFVFKDGVYTASEVRRALQSGQKARPVPKK